MIHFEKDRWDYIRERYGEWWEHKSETPVLNIVVPEVYTDERMPAAPVLSQQTCTDFSWSAKELVEALDWSLGRKEYLYEAYPYINFDFFGPGVVAAFCGAELSNDSGSVWMKPKEYLPLSEISIEYDRNNKWAKRIRDIYEAGMDRWKGNVVMGMPDLGGAMDILATLRGTENLLFDLYDEPEEVLKKCEEVNRAWDAAYADFEKILMPDSPGYTDWTGIFSEKPSYVLQSDFSYMIGTDMFEEFVLPTLQEYTKKLPNTIYHMDGVGEIKHFEYLLGLKDLKAIQWVPGDGKPSPKNWPEIYQRIGESGKGIQVVGGLDDLEAIVKAGNKNIYYVGSINREHMERVDEIHSYN